ncbi:MAG: N-6 DNA methylase [Chloroflexi bacterium]|nr:N-6 DNA methylase [Chloroflexota bacterium]
MPPDINNPKFKKLAAAVLLRHERGDAEANITSAIRDFLIETQLAKPDEIVEENPPSDGSRRAVDLTALDTFIEVKRRVSNMQAGFNPDPDYVQQIDDYLALSANEGKGVRTGILTDGRHWLLRWHGAGAVKTAAPYGFTLQDADGWLALYEWLRDDALVSLENIPLDRESIERHLGPQSPAYQRDIDTLKRLYERSADNETVKVKRRLWHDLLRSALGEIARDNAQMDDLFVRHTYLTAVIGMVVQASFGIDIRALASSNPADLVYGREFRNKTGLQGVVESDFFAWLAEVGGVNLLATMARRVARFDWQRGSAPNDIAALLYETVIPPDERRTLGEYYTPQWLARAMTRELVTDPLNQTVLDPACGSGTFIAEAIANFIDAANDAGMDESEMFGKLRDSVIGIDIHPVAVHLARAAYVLAARSAIEAASYTSITVPIYMGDALQLRYRSGDLFAEREITIQVNDDANTELAFPVSLVERPETFDSLMGDVAEYIEGNEDPMLALDDHHINDEAERDALTGTIATMQRLHNEGRNHIWAYYTRNMARPVALSRSKVDVIIGNPPWINYNQTVDILRTALERHSRNTYGIWAGGRYASNQDVAGLFYARSVDLYLREGGIIGMVLPHSALQAGQYSKWRAGAWRGSQGLRTLAVDFGYKTAWDLERLQPNTFFPVPSCVVFAKNLGLATSAIPLASEIERWLGSAGADDIQRASAGIIDTSEAGSSPYAGYARQGASIRPRRLVFVEQTENPAIIQSGQTITVNPRRGTYDKRPWRDLDLAKITAQTIETAHVFDVYLNEALIPYATLQPLKAALPIKQGEYELPTDEGGVGGVTIGKLERRMRERWRIISNLWDEHKSAASKLNLLENIDHYGKLSAQLEWQGNCGKRPIRILQSEGGQPTAALLPHNAAMVDETLYWITCKNINEAHYLLATINSDALAEAVKPLMPKGQFGARHLHKHLWKLPIPEYDGGNALHADISDAGKSAAEGAARELANLRLERGDDVSVRIARRELRAWLRSSEEGRRVEAAVGELLAQRR